MDRADAVHHGTGSARKYQIAASGCVQRFPAAGGSYR
jgi:hypothetical protein